MNSLGYVNGYYIVDNQIIKNKLVAILEASKKNTDVTWYYYDNIYDQAVKNFTDNGLTLADLYKIRALQLREKYDYLILNYSGGSDSHNILMTFLQNNIKLDHIYVQWPISLVDKGLYKPNSIDKTNANFHSEWDLVLKKDLEYISTNYPNIIIEISDWLYTLNEKFYNDNIFSKDVSNLPSIARSQKQNTFSKTESKLTSQGKLVASIYGVDKPEIVKKGNDWFFYFNDTACMSQPNVENPHGLEYFYWTPDLPNIVITQAHMLKKYYETYTNIQYLVQAYSERIESTKNYSYSDYYREYAARCEISKLVCYPYWRFDRFQADKPFAKLDGFRMGTRAWDNILTSISGFDRIQQTWEYHWKSYLSQIDKKYLKNQDTFNVIKTKWIKFS